MDRLFGTVELHKDPLQLKPWKRVIGPKQSHAVEPDMSLQRLDVSCINEFSGVKQTSEAMWLLLAISTAIDKPTTDIVSELFTCAAMSLNQFETLSLIAHDFNNNSEITLLRLSYCDYLAHSTATNGVIECYDEVIIQLIELLPPFDETGDDSTNQSTSSSSPLVCTHTSTPQSYLRCHLSSSVYRAALYALVQLVDPVQAIHFIESQYDVHNNLSLASLRRISQCLLGMGMCGDLATSVEHSSTCASVLAYAKRYAPSEAVYLLFYKLCTPSLTSSLEGRDRLGEGRFLVTSLLAVGAVEVAAKHTNRLVDALCAVSHSEQSISSHTTLQTLWESSPALRELMDRLTQQTSSFHIDSDLLESGNVRGALALFEVFHRLAFDESSLACLVQNDELLSLFLNVLMQVCSPVILDLSSHDGDVLSIDGSLRVGWEGEVVVLRSVEVTVLQSLVNRCSPMKANDGDKSNDYTLSNIAPRCLLSTPQSSVGGRGLFLLAYQGAALITSHLDRTDVLAAKSSVHSLLSDWLVPNLYHQLVVVSNPHINRQYTTHIDQSLSVGGSVRKRRVAFLSFFFTRHSVGRLLAKIVAQVNSSLFDVFIVTKQSQPGTPLDDVSTYLHSVVPPDRWLYLPLNINSALSILRSASIDVLIFGDVFMDSFVTHLAMSRAAPLQVAFWGHPFTTGYPTSMDYFVTSQHFEPHRGMDSRSFMLFVMLLHYATMIVCLHRHDQFSEQLVQFESLSFQMFPVEAGSDVLHKTNVDEFVPSSCWSTLSNEKDVLLLSDPSSFLSTRLSYLQWVLSISRNVHNTPVDAQGLLVHFLPLVESEGSSSANTNSLLRRLLSRVHVYGTLQSLMKMHPLFDRALLDILERDPLALVLLSRTPRQSVWQRKLSLRLLALERRLRGANFSGHSLLDRVLFVDQMPHAQYARLLCGVDVSLDPFPFGGGVTLCDAVSGGCASPVPFVTSGALQSVHRIGSGLAEVFNDSRVAFASKTTVVSGEYANEIRIYSTAAVKMAHRSLVRKSVAAKVPVEDVINNFSHIQHAIYDDSKAASEWNLFLDRLTRN